MIKLIGGLRFKSFKDLNLYKKVLREYHYTLQKGLCCYCNKKTYLLPSTVKNKKMTLIATIEHLEPISVTKKKDSRKFSKKFGNLTLDNTRIACHKCNNARPDNMTWLEYKSKVMGEY